MIRAQDKSLLPALLAQAFDAHPNRVAIAWRGREVTYAALSAMADQTAAALSARGAAHGAIIAVLLEDRIALVAALLGVLRLGAIYAPLDPDAPALRQSAIVAELSPACIFTEPKLAPRARELLTASGGSGAMVEIGDSAAALPSLAPAPHAPGDPCYIFYTSGSTGRPKGIVGQLKGLSHFIRWEIETFQLGAGVRVSQFTVPTFDASLRDILVPLCAGGTICVPPESPANLDAEALLAWIEESAIHLIHAVPSVFRMILGGRLHEGRLAALKRILLAGEALQVADVARWRHLFGDRIELVNLYGPTETTMVKFFHVVLGSDVERGFIPIGKPMKGAAAILVDDHGNVCPSGVAGEILIRTPFMTLGYFKDPELTARVFLPNPFGTDKKDLVYKTGDLARALEDGTFQFIGRRDSQVKIRGIRVELGEIEAALSLHPAVREAVVTAPEDSTGARRLIAYLVLRDAAQGAAASSSSRARELTGFLAERLPEGMIPRVYIPLDALPRTPTGKVDRRALPAPETSAGDDAFTAPRSPIEALLAGIWAEVLRVPRVGVHDDFFALGGHSLRATQILARVRATLGVELPLRSMFDDATLAGMAVRAEEALGGDAAGRPPPIERAPREGAGDLSFGQERLWFLDQLEPDRASYNVSGAVELTGELDALAIGSALSAIVRRHESLRTTFTPVDGRPAARIDEQAAPAFTVVDRSGAPGSERRSILEAEASAEALRPFDLARGPLLRAKLVRLGDEDHALVVTVHHIVFDGWSMGILIRELAALYGALSRGLPPELPPLPIQYADYARWQRRWLTGEALERQLAYFREQLAGSPVSLDLPTDRPRPAVQSSRGARLPMQLPAALTAALRALGRTENATLFMTLLAALQILLSRLSGQEDIVVGTPIANRTRAETEGLIGLFANTLVLRTDLSGQPSFRQALRRVREVALGAYAHQDVPFERLVEALHPARDLGHNPLFQVMFALQDAEVSPRSLPGLTLRPIALSGATAKFDLELLMVETQEGLTGSLEYSSDLFEPATAARIAERFRALLEAVVRAPDAPCVDLPWLPEAERLLLERWSAPRITEQEGEDLSDESAPFLDRFEAQAARAPSAVAAVMGQERLTYGELDRRSNRLAHVLASRGVGPEVLVALLAERSLGFLIAVLAIFKAGGAYLPLDPESPGERLRRIVEQSGAPLVLAARALMPALPLSGPMPRVLSLEDELEREAEERAPPRRGAPQSLAYVIFTSGSTGAPKGAMIEQRGMVNHLHAKIQALDLTAVDAVAQTASQCFDISVWQLLSALVVGGRVHIYPDEVTRDGAALLDAIDRDGISIFETVPSLLRAMIGEPRRPLLCRLRWMIPTGEALPPELCRAWFERYPSIPLMNAYGPTECSDDVTHFALRGPLPAAVVPIGRPIPNLRMVVLDGRRNVQPLGVPGELYVGGVGVGRGYIHDPRRTAEAFVPAPFAPEAGARLYRTGDLVRWNAQGDLEYLGRLDHQVKIRGYRIELGEIEASLAEIPALGQSVVTVARDAEGQPRLVAYVVPKEGRPGPLQAPEASAASGRIKAHLQGRLPDYMIPATFVFLDALPLTPNGKIDRRALPPPEASDGAPIASPVAPRDVVEEAVASIWTEVLKVPMASVHEDFFELGGHSLLATQVIARARAVFEVELPLRALFEAKTVAGLAERVRDAKREGPAPRARELRRLDRKGELPLSFGQERLWFLDQLERSSALYNVPVAVRLTGRLDPLALERSLSEVIRRHEVLRTSFPSVGGSPRLVLHEALEIAMPCVDLRGHAASARDHAAREEAARAAAEPFDLGRGPLLRARLLWLDSEEHVLLLTLHHIIVDGWSLGVLLRELGALYQAHCRQEPSRLDELPIQFADYAAWQRRWLEGEALEQQLTYFRRALEGAPAALDLPTDRPRPLLPRSPGGRRAFELPAELTGALRRLSREEGATLHMVLLAAFASLLSRYAVEDDIVVGTPIANRTHPATEALIGPFVNTLALRVDLSGSPSFRGAIQRVKAAALGAYAHQDLPFERLVEELRPARALGQSPIFQALFALQNAPLPTLDLPGLRLTPLDLEGGPAKFDLSLVMGELDGALAGSLQYNADLFEDGTMERFLARFRHLLASVTASPDAPLRGHSLLPEEEHRRVTSFACGQRTFPPARPEPCVHERIAEQAVRRPDAVAASCGGASISYRELDQRSNQLARLLARRGVRPGEIVGISVSRSLSMLVGILGVLKAGAAYLPLDPSSPKERRAFMLEDAKIALLLTQGDLKDALPLSSAARVLLDAEEPALLAEPPSPLEVHVLPDDLAYVIYTSGSTGTPKGTLLTHRGLSNLVRAQIDAFSIGPESRVLQFAAQSFDASVSEVFTALVAGATLLLEDSEGAILAGEALLTCLREQAVTTVTLPPSVLSTLPLADLPALRTLVCAGEPCAREGIAPWLPGRRVLNAYGPTEATVCATIAVCALDDPRPPIGRPIANVEVYVLDADLRPVGIGVPGEIYLGGPGLARGYLGRPALTAERFLPHPFSREPGERLYRTGDLARYRADGELLYLGRRDEQVKVRGYRIELGEIEAALLSHPEVRQAAVVVHPDAERLLAYVVPRSPPATGASALSPSLLRGMLRTRLLEPMIPSAFVVLAELPRTPSGKIDRRALARREGSPARAEGAEVAPRSAIERRLVELWEQLLPARPIGVTDSFFDLGGHSLLAVRLMSAIEEAFGEKLPVARLFQDATIEGLAAALGASPRARSGDLDLRAEAVLDQAIAVEERGPAQEGAALDGKILLTGVTGFLGAFLLHELLQQTRAQIYCLVRAASQGEGRRRIQEALGAYALAADSDRIVPVLGDLAEPRLGLSPEAFDALSSALSAVFHSGARVHFFEPYARLKAANVLGTQEVLRLALRGRAKPVHYISTLSVFSRHYRGQRVTERDEPAYCELLSAGYEQSKWVAERLCSAARARGALVSIYRPGAVTGHSATGEGPLDDLISRMLQGCLALGSAPDLTAMVDMTPVDHVSRAVIALAMQPGSAGGTFHLANPAPMSLLDVAQRVAALGYPLVTLPVSAFRERLRGSPHNPLTPLLPLFEDETEIQGGAIQFDCKDTLSRLEESNIKPPLGVRELLDTYLSRLVRAGLVSPPDPSFLRARTGESSSSLDRSRDDGEAREPGET